MSRTLTDIAKAIRQAEAAEKRYVGRFEVVKVVDHRVVMGWGYVSRDPVNKLVPRERTDADGIVTDWSEEHVNVYEMEKAVWGWVEDGGAGDVMHEGPPIAKVVGALTFTPEVKKAIIPGGMDPDFPEGTFLQLRVYDDDALVGIRDGTYKMLSLYGLCEHHEVA